MTKSLKNIFLLDKHVENNHRNLIPYSFPQQTSEKKTNITDTKILDQSIARFFLE